MASSIQKIHDPSIASSPGLALALCPDGRSVLTTGLDFHLRRWDLEKGICTHAWDAHGPLYAIKIVESEGSALLAAVQGIVRWDLQEWELHAANTVWSYASI